MSKELKQVKELAKDIQERTVRLRQRCKKLNVLTTIKAEFKTDCDNAYWSIQTLIRLVDEVIEEGKVESFIKEAKNE